jgi:TolA-binding protein
MIPKNPLIKQKTIIDNQISKYKNALSIAENKEKTSETEKLITNLNTKIKELKIQKNKIDKNIKKTESERNKELSELNDISKHLPVLLNIICTTPTMIANIFVGILNKVGEMKNLPNLWDFPLVE